MGQERHGSFGPIDQVAGGKDPCFEDAFAGRGRLSDGFEKRKRFSILLKTRS